MCLFAFFISFHVKSFGFLNLIEPKAEQIVWQHCFVGHSHHFARLPCVFTRHLPLFTRQQTLWRGVFAVIVLILLSILSGNYIALQFVLSKTANYTHQTKDIDVINWMRVCVSAGSYSRVCCRSAYFIQTKLTRLFSMLYGYVQV